MNSSSESVYAVPAVSGMNVTAASDLLTQAGFTPGPQRTFSDVASSWSVAGTSPEAGESLPRGSEVNLIVSAGAMADDDQLLDGIVPDVAGLDVNSAVEILFSKGYTVTFQFHADEDTPADHIIVTHPRANTALPPGATLVVAVSTGSGGPVDPPLPWPPDEFLKS